MTQIPINIPPALTLMIAQAIERWRGHTDQLQSASQLLADKQTAVLKSEAELKELARAVSIILATHGAHVAPTVPPAPPPSAEELSDASDVVMAWMKGQGITPGGGQ